MPDSNVSDLNPATFGSSFSTASREEKLRILKGMTPATARNLASLAPALLEKETDGEVAAAIITGIGTTWPKTHLKTLSSRILSESLAIRVAVVEVLGKLAPQALVDYLPKLLVSNEPRLRTLAIKGLAEIDLDEALAHLDYLMMSTEHVEKQAGLQCSFFLPFDRVKPVAMKFVAAEHDLQMLEQIGLLLGNNPDPEIPLRLWEMAGQASPEKAGVLKNLVQEACQAIEASGVLGDQYPAYMEKLKRWILKKETTRFVQDCIDRLTNADQEGRARVEAAIVRQLQKPLVREALFEAVHWPLDPEVRQHLEQILKIPKDAPTPAEDPPAASAAAPDSAVIRAAVSPTPVAPPATPAPPPAPVMEQAVTGDQFFALTPERRMDLMATWDVAAAALATPILEKLAASGKPTSGEWAVAFRAARAVAFGGLLEKAGQLVKNVDPNLATAALEYLAEFDPDAAFPHVGKFLQSQNVRMKTSAIRIMNRFDSKQALSSLRTMLGAKDILQQKLALACMVHFDFSLVRESLVEFLHTVPEASLIQAGLFLFAANPDPDSIYEIYRLEKLLPGGLGTEAFSIRRKVEKSLIEMNRLAADQKAQDQSLEKRWQAEQKKGEEPPPQYSVRSLKAAGQLKDQSPGSRVSEVALSGMASVVGTVMQYSVHLFLAGLLIAAWFIFGYLNTLFQHDKQKITIGAPLSLVGEVTSTSVDFKTVEVNTDLYGLVEVRVPAVIAWRPSQGSKFKGTVLPIQVKFGKVISDLQNLEAGPGSRVASGSK